MLVIYILGAYLTANLDTIFNISKRSMMPEWHQFDSSSTMSEQQEKTLKSSSRSFWFSTGLIASITGGWVGRSFKWLSLAGMTRVYAQVKFYLFSCISSISRALAYQCFPRGNQSHT